MRRPSVETRNLSGVQVGSKPQSIGVDGGIPKIRSDSRYCTLSGAQDKVHAERLVHKLEAFTDENRKAQRHIRSLIWRFYRDLKAYRLAPSEKRKASLTARFDRIFTRKTGFVTLDRLLQRLHANKAELLKVLERPEIPLHTNGSENDIRSVVTKRKVSGGTRSDVGRDCRDGFLSLAKTCKKLGIAFWDYLGSRLGVSGQPEVPRLADIVKHRCASA